MANRDHRPGQRSGRGCRVVRPDRPRHGRAGHWRRPDGRRSREALLVGAPLPTGAGPRRQASPLSHVRAGAPPFLLLHGRDDQLIPCSQSQRLREALVQAGNFVEFETYAGSDHMWRGAPAAAADALERTIDFLRRMLR